MTNTEKIKEIAKCIQQMDVDQIAKAIREIGNIQCPPNVICRHGVECNSCWISWLQSKSEE